MKYPGFIGGSYKSQSVLADVERSVNFYTETIEAAAGGNRSALYPTPGCKPFVQAVDGITDIGTRALWGGLTSPNTEQCFAIVGGGFYEIFANQTVTRRGTVTRDGMPGQIVYNGTAGGQFLVGSGSNAYCYVPATKAFTQVLTGAATMIGMLDEFGLAFSLATGQVRLSALNDFTTWDPTQFFANSITADPWQSMIVDRNRQIWMIGQKTGQVYYDSGAFPQPFAPVPGAVFGDGIAAPFAWALAGPYLVWLARNEDGAGRVVSAQGYVPQRVSNYAVDTALAGYARSSSLTDAEAVAYQDQGHTFWNLSIPSVKATWSIDVDNHAWHERGAWIPNQRAYDVWRPRCHAYVFGRHLVGDRATGTIATMDVSFGTEVDGSAIRRLRIAPGIALEGRRVPYHQLQLFLETGVGLVQGQGSQPTVMLRSSDDFGRTYGNERRASAGAMGAYRKRVYWNQLGVSDGRVFKASFSDPVPWRIVDAYINNFEGQAA